MTELDEDKLLRRFFDENKQEIADNGFSKSVIRNLPDRKRNWVQILNIITMLISLTLFFVLGGLKAFEHTLREVFIKAFDYGVANLDPKTLIIVAIVLLVLGTRKVCSMA